MIKKSLLIISLMIGITNGAFYSLQPDFTVVYQKTSDQLAHCYFDQKHNSEGWNYLKIYANINKDLIDQHRGAGFLEGYLTYNHIYYSFKNWQKVIMSGNQLKPKLVNFLNDQIDYIDSMADAHPKQLYWQYAKAKMEQLRYMYRGFLTRIHIQNRLDLYLSWIQFYSLTNVGDLQDLVPAFNYFQQENTNQKKQNQEQTNKSNLMKQAEGNCNGIVKLINGELYIAHSTHNKYQFMLRVFKTYNFPTRDSKVGSQTITFSSRPGDLISKDDFYVLSSGLIVMQSSMENMNDQNYKEINSKTVPTWLRQTIACHLAKTSEQWLNYHLKQRSGTHNSQWVIVDPKNLNSKVKTVLYLEEAFSIYQIIDVTNMLFSQGYVPTYNQPYSQRIYKKLGYEGAQYDYNTQPRAGIYKKYNQLMKNQEDMKKWLITNEQQDPRVGLAPRYDLYQGISTPFGLTDCKIISPRTLKQNYIWAISGPTQSNGRFPPFDWNNWSNHFHLGMPDVYNFTWVQVNIHDKSELVAEENNLNQKIYVQM